MSNRISAYLDNQRIHYSTVEHDTSHNSFISAFFCQVPLQRVAKAVMLEDHESKRLMAILPASHKISLSKLNTLLNRELHIMSESKLFKLFSDCAPGAVPPIAEAYHLDMVYDDLLLNAPVLYIESGDHQHMLLLEQNSFRNLVKQAKHFRFSHESYH